MVNNDKELFRICEITKTLGITRRILINYEEHGLLTPAVKNENSGFRYYSADNMVHIKLIRTLQNLGLSLAEIKKYFNNTSVLGEQINRLVLLRNQLDQYIAQLRLREYSAKKHEIINVTLPAFTAFCKDFNNANLSTKTVQLRKTYTEAVKKYQLDINNKMCIQVSVNTDLNGQYIIPVVPESKGKYIKTFSQVSAICIYYRGAYENFPEVQLKLLRYAKENGMTPHGYFRNIYMEGPPTHGANKNAYVTQIALPIKFLEI